MMKKRMISFMLLTLMVLAAKAQENVFRLSGSLESTGDTITVYCVDLAQRRIVETKPVAVSADKFETTMELAQPVMLMLQNKPAPGRLNSRIQIFAVPNSQCAINGKWLDYTLSGDQFYLDLNEIKQLTAETDKAMHDLSWECQQRANNGEKEDVIMKYYEEKSAPILEKKNKLVMDYAASHGNHDATATLLMAVEPEQAQGLCDKLSETVRNGQMKPMIDGTMAQVKKELARKEREKELAPGKPAPDFTLNDINGKPLALSSLRGKYVVLDFWGSWCGWCIKGIPQMKEYYAKYNAKMEILGIDCNDTDQKWKDAVAKYELPWKHVYHPKDGEVTTLYAIQGYPTKIVIDPQGNIAKVVVGEDPAFYTYLDELLK